MHAGPCLAVCLNTSPALLVNTPGSAGCRIPSWIRHFFISPDAGDLCGGSHPGVFGELRFALCSFQRSSLFTISSAC